MSRPGSSGRALALGAVSGLRTFGALGPLGVRGRLGGRIGRLALPTLLAGEIAGDKHPAIPPRSDPAPVVGRLAAGALAGWTVGGAQGAGAGATGAAATTYASERARTILTQRASLPDPLVGVAEDALAVGVALAASREREPAPDPEGAASRRISPVAAAARGAAAAAVGTAAMTTAQTAYGRATGARPSRTPETVGRRIVHGVMHRRVPRGRRDALGQAMHVLYGTSWGLPFGLVAGSRRAGASRAGVAFGLVVWAFGLTELPVLKLAPVPWRQSPTSLGVDLGFHLVYGTTTAAAYRAFDNERRPPG